MNIMFRIHQSTTTIACAVKVLAVIAALVLAVVAGFNAFWFDLVFAVGSNANELLFGAALFLLVSATARAVQWATEQGWDIDLPEVELPEVRIALNEAVTA